MYKNVNDGKMNIAALSGRINGVKAEKIIQPGISECGGRLIALTGWLRKRCFPILPVGKSIGVSPGQKNWLFL